MFQPCVVIPVYDHEHAIGAVVARVLAHGLPLHPGRRRQLAGCARVLDALARGVSRSA